MIESIEVNSDHLEQHETIMRPKMANPPADYDQLWRPVGNRDICNDTSANFSEPSYNMKLCYE